MLRLLLRPLAYQNKSKKFKKKNTGFPMLVKMQVQYAEKRIYSQCNTNMVGIC